jgi:type I restriction enzyme S subunit
VEPYRSEVLEQNIPHNENMLSQAHISNQSDWRKIVEDNLNGYSSSQDIPAFDIGESIDSEWLLYYISRPSFYKKLEHYSTGSGSKRLHPRELFKIRLYLPPLLKQKQIAKTLNTAKKEITILEKILAKYKSQKKGLMQKLLTGKIRVNNINSIN